MEIHSNLYVFQDTTIVGNGKVYNPTRDDQITFFITGNSTSRTIYFEGSDAENNWFSIPAVKLPELTSAISTIGNNEVWVIDTGNWVSIRTRISAIDGGTVRITGKIVESGYNFIKSSSIGSQQVNIIGTLINNQTSKAVTASTNILTANYTSLNYQQSTLMVSTSTTGILSLAVDGVLSTLNSGVALDINKWYAFDVLLLKDSTYNLQLSVDATMQIKWAGGA